MKNQDVLISKVWEVELEIMDVIHNICVENDLKYTLAYGTLLGAVRHQGFIPWDDDIDIMMPRDDYEKLIEIWQEKAPADYIMQTYKTDLDYTNNFAKVRKNGTTFLQSESERMKKYHKGIFVDIFPGDRLAKGAISRKIQYVASAVNLLYSRGYQSGRKGIFGIVENILLKCSQEKYAGRREKAEKIMRAWNHLEKSPVFLPCTIEACRIFYPGDMFEQLMTMEFSGRKYCVASKYDAILKIEYGDYMQLPPVEERKWGHHPIIIDFEHNYEEIKGKS